jgi:hypothetical protein
MPAPILNLSATISCPHGGLAVPVPSNPGLSVAGMPVLCLNDSFPIVGCTFNVAGAPAPCLLVQWSMPAVTVTVRGIPCLLATSIGLCVGGSGAVPAIVTQGQAAVLAN